jgi:hypothetical protein
VGFVPLIDMASQSDPESSEQGLSASERRSNLVLRALIDEMLERVRELNRNTGVWNGEERARAEAELDGIMARVRRVASQRHTD